MSNILFICPNPVWGGAATATIEIAKLLHDNGHKVIFNDEYSLDKEINGLRIDHTPIHQKRFTDRKLLYKLIEKHDINCIIWSQLVAIYFLNDIISLKKKGIKQISIVHSLSLRNNLKGRLIDYFVSLSLAQMSTIVYVSQFTKESWSKFRVIRKSKAQQIVIHNLVRLVGTEHKLQIERPRIGVVGRLSEEKQPEIFCELSINTNYDFSVYGDGPMIEELKAKYHNIKFKGRCNDVKEIYPNIDVLVMTSKFENCPMTILEARAFGIPCVAPEVGGIPEIVDNTNGVLYVGYDSQIILNAIKAVLLDYPRFASNIKNNCNKDSISEIYSKWKEVLN